eukprot:CAMPEP_0170221334 /NCGR_PEP_ID=MMETSP0116_2-20130129/10354_1 /TAXON_ID=400756 /ORGANISM="Durinskia baltica, Strain CSIRO CS-38" /LENGTH=450 /DNA_ID=CAMNT_0010472011 /DNA_START=86 /DNA_END=1438 /DNA_ORIENTATION=-
MPPAALETEPRAPPAPTPAEPPSTFVKVALFVFFVVTRAAHPMLIDFSKVGGKILYARDTPIFMNKVLTIVLMNLAGLAIDGMEGVRMCWRWENLKVFGPIGLVYALGDFLEMLSLSGISGDVYQVLLQTKLLITAMIVWWLKGQRQTSLQWYILWGMFLATSAFVLVDHGDNADGKLGLGVVSVIMKVVTSCYVAVLSEKYLKAFGNLPIYAKISGLSGTWMIASSLVCFSEDKVRNDGFFANWNEITWLIVASFIIKSVSTLWLLQVLDSVQKNIGEALAVIVIYVAEVFHPSFDKTFELTGFLLSVLVVMLVQTYLSAPKAPKPGAEAPKPFAGGRIHLTKLVSVEDKGAPLLQGVDAKLCEAADALPAGAFYGVVSGSRPVVGNTDAGRKTRCQLVALGSGGEGFAAGQPLSVLGTLRGPLPSGASPDEKQWAKDMASAKEQFATA